MAIQDMTPADLAAVVNDNDGFGGGNGWWIILLFLFLGWGNNGWGGNNVANDAGMADRWSALIEDVCEEYRKAHKEDSR